MLYEWDPRKAARNLRKHKVSFLEAATVFPDLHAPADFCSSLTPTAPTWSASSVLARRRKRKPMPTKKVRSRSTDELRREYKLSELGNPIRGKHYLRATAGSNLVLLDPDVVQAFPSAEAVNGALRLLVSVARARVRTGKPARRQPAQQADAGGRRLRRRR